MYLMEDFVQSKFIEGQTGQKFSFQDKIIMNLADQRQHIDILPELDSSLKVVIREQFGVNAQLSLVSASDRDGPAIQEGRQVGTTEILYVPKVAKGQAVTVRLDYSHSVLAFHTFTECPHLPIEVSMISLDEKAGLEAAREGQDSDPRASRTRLRALTADMGLQQPTSIRDPETEGRFVLQSRQSREFEILHSGAFEAGVKMGLFAEVFYSPYMDEVLELYVASSDEQVADFQLADPSECDEEDEDGSCSTVLSFDLAKYKSSKSVWVDLEPGAYTFQILLFRQPDEGLARRTEKVPFQLYVDYDFVNTAREVFFPHSLNYYGLLGFQEETRDFGQVTLLYDDLTLWHRSISSTFQVESEMASAAVQVEQEDALVKVKVYKQQEGRTSWTPVGVQRTWLSPTLRLDGVQLDTVEQGVLYKIELYKDAFTEHAQIEDVEMGERYGTSFSLKIDFTENDDEAIAASWQRQVLQKAPHSIDEVAKTKRAVEGLKESAFWLGNRSMLSLLG